MIYFISFPRVLATPRPWVGPGTGNLGIWVGKEEVGNVLGTLGTAAVPLSIKSHKD